MQNPDLLNPAAGNATSVPALTFITKPMGNTAVEPVWFYSPMVTVSFHRQDGKKLPFLNHLYKATFAEDIKYLMDEIEKHENPYVRLASQQEVEHAKLMEDPMGTVREAVKKELSIEDLEKLLAQRRQAESTAKDSNNRIEGVDPANSAGQVKAVGVTNLASTHASATGANTASLGAMLAKVTKKS